MYEFLDWRVQDVMSQPVTISADSTLGQAEEILEQMREDLSQLADQGAPSSDVDSERVNRLFRCAHSLKGLSGMFGFDAMSELAHHLEDVLDRLRMGRVALDSRAVGLLDESVALLATMLEKLGDDSAEAEAAANKSTADAAADAGYPASATLCNKCHTKAVVIMDNCATCLSCGYSKCG